MVRMSMKGRTPYPSVEKDLEALGRAVNYNRWLYTLCKPYLGTRILEIGAGIGNYTKHWVRHGAVWATDCEDYYLDVLRSTFRMKAVRVSRLPLDNWTKEQRNEVRRFHSDSIVCLNVLEHVEDDVGSVAAMVDCISPGGRLIIIVPALAWLYSRVDANYGHTRRYDKRRLRLIRDKTHTRLLHLQYFNLLGTLAWLWNYKVLARPGLIERQVMVFDRLVPLLSRLERCTPPPFGLSLIAVLRKEDHD